MAQKNLAFMVSARENIRLKIANRRVPWRMIAPPKINPNPIEPSIPRKLGLGVLLGLAAGASAGLLRYPLDQVFHQPG